MNTNAPGHFSKKWLRLTLVEWLVIGVILVILATLLFSPTKWGGSGFVDVPIRVVVFDATQGQPIKDARVAIQKYSSDRGIARCWVICENQEMVLRAG